MHILFLTDNFPPEVNAPASRTFEHCREWVRAGHEVTVITCAPNFPRGVVYAGYRNRLWQTERMEGIRVVRVWTYITANEGFLRRTLDYVSFMVAAVLAAPFVRRVDVIVATSPQFFTACAGYLVSVIKRSPFAFELRDIWPESIRAVGIIEQGRILRLLEKIEMFLYRHADAIVAVTHSFRKVLIARGVDSGKISVVLNGADLDRFRPLQKDQDLAAALLLEHRLVAGYVGTHGLAHALETILQAAAIVAERAPGLNLSFVLLGDGAMKEKLKSRAAEMRLQNVVFVDTVPKADVPRYWSLIDISIIHLKREPLFETVIPSKLFECMAMGIPVLHGVVGESSDIVTEENVGMTFEPQNAEDLAQKLQLLAVDMDLRRRLGENGRLAAPHYDRRAKAADMLAILQHVVHRPAAR
jgi:glycosyltransferase involved in cell wall biosynthesis